MALLESINAAIKEALKSGQRNEADTLRFLVAQMHNRSIEKRGKGGEEVLTGDEIVDVLRKEAKKRKEAADLYRQGGRADLAEKEEEEIAVIQKYLPATPGEADIRRVVGEMKASGLTAFPELMKESMARLKGADGSLVAKIIKENQ